MKRRVFKTLLLLVLVFSHFLVIYALPEMQIESKFIISSKLTVEGPLRMKQEFLEGLLESPKVNEESIPQQLRGALAQATNAAQQLPALIRDTVSGGLRIPLGEHFQFRETMHSNS